MTIKDDKIVEITESELFDYYLTRGWDDIMSFTEFKEKFSKSGCKVV